MIILITLGICVAIAVVVDRTTQNQILAAVGFALLPLLNISLWVADRVIGLSPMNPTNWLPIWLAALLIVFPFVLILTWRLNGKSDHITRKKCLGCHQDIEADAPEGVNICGSCADDLRAEQDALEGAAMAEAQDRARTEFEANREAYEEEERARHFDNGDGYRYI